MVIEAGGEEVSDLSAASRAEQGPCEARSGSSYTSNSSVMPRKAA